MTTTGTATATGTAPAADTATATTTAPAAESATTTTTLTAVTTTTTAPAPSRQTAVRGGDTIYGSGGTRCTVGFNARRGEAYHAVVEGRCAGSAGTTWYADPALTKPLGTTAAVSFPGTDYAAIRYTSTAFSYPGEISTGGGRTVDITGTVLPPAGSRICHVGRTTGLQCGTVTAHNVSITYPEGTVRGLIRSNACTEPGDWGGPAFSGTLAVGFIVGGSGNCSTGGVTYYQPIQPALTAYGLSVY